ncbi:MAG TPA: potassium-transporting ATPase subunit KdpC [Anaerolineaceae bacterium]|jgi:K+-transporting ATPase KdpC subunit
MKQQWKPAIVIFGLMVIITGVIYPLAMTGIAQAIFPAQATGSLVYRNGQVAGSALIGQPFDDPKYFWGRLSATSPYPDNAAASSGSNLGPTNPKLIEEVQVRIDALKKADPGNSQPIPVDLVTSSGSGLDPDISPAAAYYQAGRVARVRGLDMTRVNALIVQHIQGRQFGFLGEERVNVLELNLALDQLQ